MKFERGLITDAKNLLNVYGYCYIRVENGKVILDDLCEMYSDKDGKIHYNIRLNWSEKFYLSRDYIERKVADELR